MRKLCEQCGQKDCGFVNRGMEDDCEKVQWYQQGYDDAIDRACEWWVDELSYPSMTQEELRWCKNKVNAFRKEMEGGENTIVELKNKKL